jgi:hypothetical protein
MLEGNVLVGFVTGKHHEEEMFAKVGKPWHVILSHGMIRERV